ncbi:dienelactone hydrolase [Pseudodesulfovibrio cashew]|uniref:Dienelactone hydrolase n=1 Tax=Pseudodesulfovibrio cashew TaxID=2678688 RepID=A0A6I6JEJ0_9BACT|nr:dienelactone hydrolase [Pseudodesulfovibrio cashew]QGY40561.1 dienelactone hydrolase [Pseudodesulfovibrio cashew]
MRIMLVTEIWGRTPHVERLAAGLGHAANRVSIIDPYGGYDPAFPSEEAAYDTFIGRCGHAAYAERVSEALAEADSPVCLVGFSAGAGAVWAAVCGDNAGRACGAIGVYGSAIRSMTDLDPKVPIELIFPEIEPHFDVAALVRSLRGKPNVSCRTVPQGHGFMNPLSVNYDEAACEQWAAWIAQRAMMFFKTAE